jgi:diguanylate cyclase (GGDEF)-like protein
MDPIRWVDNRTLLLCLWMLVTVFSALMLGVRSLYPRLPGIGSVTAGFCLGTVATFLFVPAGWLPVALSMAGGGGAAMLSSIFLYRGILEFCRHRTPPRREGISRRDPIATKPPANLLPLLYAVAVPAEGLLLYSSGIHLNPAVCLGTLTVTLALARFLMAWTLLRSAAGRKQLLAFAGTMGLFGLLAAARTLLLLVSPPPTPLELLQHDRTQSATLMMSATLVCVQGLFYLLMFAGSIAETMEEQAQLDYVSGTLNRRGIESALEGEIARSRRSPGEFAVLLIDIDHFKTVNDRFGHAAGDEALRRVAAGIGATIRVYDVLGRFGGDEFLLLLPHTGGPAAMLIAERLREAVQAEPGTADSPSLTLSIGVTICSQAEQLTDILARADEALYEAKLAGRDRAILNPAGAPEWNIRVEQTEGTPPAISLKTDPSLV